MPFAFTWGASQKKGVTPSSPSSGIPPSIAPGSNPRAPPPTQSRALAQGTKVVNTESIALRSGKTTQGQTYNLPLSDINKLQLDLSSTTFTGTLTDAIDTTAVIDHISLADASGAVFANIPGGTFLLDNYNRFTVPKPTYTPSFNNATTATALTDASLLIPNTRIPAASGGTTGCQLTVTYAALPAGLTALTVSDSIRVHFGATDGYQTRYVAQNLALVSGDNLLQTNSVPQTELISELFIRDMPAGYSSNYDIDYVRIQTNGQVIEGNLSGSALAARNIEQFPNSSGSAPTFQTDTVCLLEGSYFAMNSSSEFDINMLDAASSAQFVWVFYSKVA